MRTVAPPHFKNILKAGGGDQAGAGAFPLQQGICPDRCAMNDGGDIREIIQLAADSVDKTNRLVSDGTWQLAGGGGAS